MICPYCNSENTQGTNIGTRAFAHVASVGAGMFGAVFGPTMAHGAMHAVNKSICEYREYICLSCKNTFREE